MEISRSMLPVYLVFVGLVLFTTREYGQAAQSPIELSNLHKVAANCVAGLMLAVYFMRRGFPRNWVDSQKYYLVFLLAAIASTLAYSTNVLYSTWKIFEALLAFLLSLFILSRARCNPKVAFDFYETTLGFARFILAVTVLGVLVLPTVAIRSPLSAESLAAFGTPILPYQVYGSIIQVNPNTLGALSAVLVVVHGRRFLQGNRHVPNVIWLLLSTAFLVFSQSRTAWAGLLAAFLATLALSPRIHATKKTLIALLILTFAFTFLSSIYDYLSRGVGVDRLLTLSGRVGWWEAAAGEFLTADFLGKTIGLGFMTANREILTSEFDAGAASTLHSDFIDALVSTGVVGFAMICLALFATVWRTWRLVGRERGELPLELLGVLLILAVRAFTGTTVASHNVFLVMFFAVSVLVGILHRESLHVARRSAPPARWAGNS